MDKCFPTIRRLKIEPDSPPSRSNSSHNPKTFQRQNTNAEDIEIGAANNPVLKGIKEKKDASDAQREERLKSLGRSKFKLEYLRPINFCKFSSFIGSLVNSLFESKEKAQFSAGRLLVELQIDDHNQLLPFKYTSHGNLVDLRKLLESLSSEHQEYILNMQDGVGACILHIAYLYECFNIGRYLVALKPKLCTNQYSMPKGVDNHEYLPYLGENILHMCIVKRNLTEVKWLFEFLINEKRKDLLDELLSARTFGHFFQPNNHGGGNECNDVYFGEYPILFAVCCNDTDILDVFLDYQPLSIFVQDGHGNNALHMCVIHSLKKMFDYVMVKADQAIESMNYQGYDSKEKRRELLDRYLFNEYNHKGQTPFTLAAAMGNKKMFLHLLQIKKITRWTYGPVHCSIVSLSGLDSMRLTRQNDVDPDQRFEALNFKYEDDGMTKQMNEINGKPIKLEPRGAIDWICHNNHLELLDIPEVKEIITKKWERFGFPQFLRSATLSLFVTILITLIICLYPFSVGDTPEDWIEFMLFIVTEFLVLVSVFSDASEMWHSGWTYFGIDGWTRGAALLQNITTVAEFLFFSLACLTKAVMFKKKILGDVAVRVFLSAAALSSWVKIYYVLMGLKTTGNFVVIVTTILTKDFPQFLSQFFVTLFGFGSAVAALRASNNFIRTHFELPRLTVRTGFRQYFAAIWDCLVFVLSGGNIPVPMDGVPKHAVWLFKLLTSLYAVIVTFILINILIAMMSNTYEMRVEGAKLIQLRENYNIMRSFEKGTDEEGLNKARGTYAINDPTPSADDKKKNAYSFFEMQSVDQKWVRVSGTWKEDDDDEEDNRV